MELCTFQAVLNLPLDAHHHHHHHRRHRFLAATPAPETKTSLSFKQASASCAIRRLLIHRVLLPRATTEETTETSKFVEEEVDGVITVEDVASEKDGYSETFLNGEPKLEAPLDQQIQMNEFLEKLNIKLGTEDAYPILLYGSGALVALWLASVVVGAIESIPLFPKLMEVVGLGYTVWFSSRYLLFKENRDELAAKIEELKRQVLGLSDD
ncbi:hypothetical protein SLEP1_g29050 [Rubroshorea leprosula]|uniref:Cyanobacterial aminoacyl-tRNA synthetase CAAD domain-containing protein n=1 Tax=Rubroshorea leprosula TaxID=152421 RepID=A0AAV5JVP2_9ROSI|nr:hypothetical protein SLEP1_g29050 [Rubroshorea leprosula]